MNPGPVTDSGVERFFDTDFLVGPMLLHAEEKAPGQLQITKEAWRIAAGLKPTARDLRMVRVSPRELARLRSEPPSAVPASGYIGPYPLREREPNEEVE